MKPSALAAITKAVHKTYRIKAHIRLREWAEQRETVFAAIGWSSESVFERQKRGIVQDDYRADKLTGPERAAYWDDELQWKGREGRVIQIDGLVRDLPAYQRMLVVATYVNKRSIGGIAEASGRSYEAVRHDWQEAQLRVGSALEALMRGTKKAA